MPNEDPPQRAREGQEAEGQGDEGELDPEDELLAGQVAGLMQSSRCEAERAGGRSGD